jgi:hypothetical protein
MGVGGQQRSQYSHTVGACAQYCETIFMIAAEKCPTRLGKYCASGANYDASVVSVSSG